MPTTRTFLIIDDDEDTLFLRRHALEKAFRGCRVLEARSPEQALQAAGTVLHAIIADHFVRSSHGAESMRYLMERSPGCPLVVVTNSDDPKLRRRAVESGATVVLDAGNDFCRWLRARLG